MRLRSYRVVPPTTLRAITNAWDGGLRLLAVCMYGVSRKREITSESPACAVVPLYLHSVQIPCSVPHDLLLAQLTEYRYFVLCTE